MGPQTSEAMCSPGAAVVGGSLRRGALVCFPWAHAEHVRSGGVVVSDFGISWGICSFAMDWIAVVVGWFIFKCQRWCSLSVGVSCVSSLGSGRRSFGC